MLMCLFRPSIRENIHYWKLNNLIHKYKMDIYANLAIFFATSSIFISLVVIAVHISIPKLLQHPGEFILIQCFSQFFLDVHWLEVIDSFWK